MFINKIRISVKLDMIHGGLHMGKSSEKLTSSNITKSDTDKFRTTL